VKPPEGTGPTVAVPRQPTAVYLVLFAAATLVILGTLRTLPLTDPDEVFYAETAREMLAAKSVLTPVLFGQPQFEKPPLTYWLLGLSFAVVGEHPWSARLVPALFGILGALMAFFFGRFFVPDGVAALAALMLLTGFAYLGQSIALSTDMVFTTFVASAFYAFSLWTRRGRSAYLYGFAALAALAVLTKGPVALVILMLGTTAFLTFQRDIARLKAFLLHPWWLVFVAMAAPWFLYMALVHGRAFLWEFFVHDNWHRILRAEHPGFDHWYFYPVVILVGLLPWTGFLAFLGAGFREHRELHVFLLSWIGAVYASFAIAHSRLPSYVLPLSPALALLLAVSVTAGVASPRRRSTAAVVAVLGGLGLLAAPFLASGDIAEAFRPVLVASGVYGVALFAVAGLLLAGRLSGAIILNAGCLLSVVLVATFNLPPVVGRAFTDDEIPALVARLGLAGQTIVASAVSARGVYYHSGNPVTVMDRTKHPFWSELPIAVLASDADVTAFFAARDTVLCVMTPGDLDRLNRLFGASRRQEVLSSAYRRDVVLSRRR
jgi:4-amino-4-deoxy-L-arabinose transferase-like glycosyltransferase